MLVKCTTLLNAGMQVTVQTHALFFVKESIFSAFCCTHLSYFVIVIRDSTETLLT